MPFYGKKQSLLPRLSSVTAIGACGTVQFPGTTTSLLPVWALFTQQTPFSQQQTKQPCPAGRLSVHMGEGNGLREKDPLHADRHSHGGALHADVTAPPFPSWRACARPFNQKVQHLDKKGKCRAYALRVEHSGNHWHWAADRREGRNPRCACL